MKTRLALILVWLTALSSLSVFFLIFSGIIKGYHIFLLLFYVTLFVLVVALIVGIFVWSFFWPKRIKFKIWAVYALAIIILILPLTSHCPEVKYDNDPKTYDNDVIICKVVFPYEPLYWVKAYNAITGNEEPKDIYRSSGNRFFMFGTAYLILERTDNIMWYLRR